MPRPRKFDTDETIDQITTLFWAKGFDAVSIKEIAALTGLRPGSLYASFGNKDEIFDLAYERYGRIFQLHMQITEQGIEGAEAYLKRLVESALDDPERKGCLIINTARELDVHTPKIRDLTAVRLDEMEDFFRHRLAEDGIISECFCHALFGAAVAVLTLSRSAVTRSTLDDIVSVAISAVRNDKRLFPRG